MSGLNANYIITPPLQDYFVDKTTGLPLAGGYVYFYQDNSRSTLLPVYELTDLGGGNYEYTVLPNPLILSSVGTAQDNSGNDIAIYLYPYITEIIDDEPTEVLTLYYIQVYDSNMNLQFTRSAWPNLIAEEEPPDDDIAADNFIPNGQFLLHDNYYLPSSTTQKIGQVNSGYNVVAPGNWYYENLSGSTDVDTVTWTRFNTFVQIPENSPRYAANIQCVTAGNSTYKHFGVRFYDVNKFSSAEQMYTFSCAAISTTGTTVSVWTRKFFGTGGSPTAPIETNIGMINVSATYPTEQQSFNFVFGDNSGYTLGTNNDDYVDIFFKFPTTATFNYSFTNMLLIEGELTEDVLFPVTTNNDFLIDGLLGSIPTPDYGGLNYYLPIVATPSGFNYDISQVGKIYARAQSSPIVGELLCDGTTYISSWVSSNLIPYSRLGSALWDSTYYQHYFGGGTQYVSVQPYQASGFANYLYFSSNQVGTGGSTSVPTDITSTGLTYQLNVSAKTSAYGVRVAYNDSHDLSIMGNSVGSYTAPSSGSSGFPSPTIVYNSSAYRQYFILNVSTVPSAGTYWTFSSSAGNFYVWYQINGSGSDPAPGGTGILVNLNGNASAPDVATATMAALLGGYTSTVICPAASGITAGSYFGFGTVPYKFYVWFSVNGVGSDPLLSGYTAAIPVSLPTGATNVQVAQAIQIAVNQAAYGVPNYQGLFLRGYDPNSIWDLGTRIAQFNNPSQYSPTESGGLGSTELFNVQQIAVPYGTTAGAGAAFVRSVTQTGSNTVGTNGETIPINTNVNWFIKY